MLSRGELRVVCDSEQEDCIYAWAALEPERQIVHFVYVRPEMRRLGCAKALLGKLGQTSCVYTARPRPEVQAKIPPSWVYVRDSLYEPMEVTG